MVKTRRISIIPYDEETKKETYKKLDDWRYESWKLGNRIYTGLYVLESEARRIASETNRKLADVKKELMSPITNEMTYVYSFAKSVVKEKKLHSNIAGALAQNTLKKFKTEKPDIFRGNRALSTYKRENMNIYFPVGIRKKDEEGNPIPSQGAKSGIYIDGCDYILYTSGCMKYKLFFGRDRSNNKHIVDQIIAGNYKLCDSYIKRDKKGYSYYLCVDIPVQKKKLNPAIAVGVDLGISIPAVCALNEGGSREFIGNGGNIRRFRFQMASRRRSLQKSCKYAKGGKGRKKKLKALDRFKEYESNFIKTLNHKYSREIVDFAIKNNAGSIKLEMLDGFGTEHKNNLVLKNWTYFQLSSMIAYKAKEAGIEVLYIDPYHTSKICSFCGKLHENLTLNDREIECECGEKYNRDYNAAVNIARSSEVVTKKEDCVYYKLHRKDKITS